ncbi:MAG: penicillin-binding transpeptidase domain-containing protein [Desulfatirhabdiaceae bacterium]
MKDKPFVIGDNPYRQDWKEYQVRLRRIADSRRRFRRLYRYSAIAILIMGIVGYLCIDRRVESVSEIMEQTRSVRTGTPTVSHPSAVTTLNKKQIQVLLEEKPIINLKTRQIKVDQNGQSFRLTTSLIPSLQQFALSKLNTTTSRHIGIVIMSPSTGRILTMVGFDKINPSGNPCVEAVFPAASIFKIITAAAAIEKCDMTAGSSISFTGGKHTLYKSQLKEASGRYARKMTLRDSFAQSVNPVFGKIGARYLGKSAIEDTAESFGFNQAFDFDMPVSPSEIVVLDEPFQLAEVASGYNRTTLISPLHAAMIASAVLNDGKMIEPSIIDQVVDESGRIVYEYASEILSRPLSARSSQIMEELMSETIGSGTGRKAFRGYTKDSVLSRLDLGGKTGTIDNHSHDVRYDWFVGYGSDKHAEETIVASVVVAHEKYIGVRAGQYARMLIREYFNQYFVARQNTVQGKKAKQKG